MSGSTPYVFMMKNRIEEKQLWEEIHKESGYSSRIFSLLDSDLVLNKFRMELSRLVVESRPIRILIPGCGSNINLQKCCYNVFGDNAQIDALDWSEEAIKLSAQQTAGLGLRITYINQSYYELSIDDSTYDVIVLANAIVSESESNNESAVKNLTRLLKPGGVLLGLFPSPFNMLDYSLTNPDAHHWICDGKVDVNKRQIHEDGDTTQRFFSPLELYMLLKRTGLYVKAFELFFYDDETFARQISELYHIPYNNEYCFWGYFINSIKH